MLLRRESPSYSQVGAESSLEVVEVAEADFITVVDEKEVTTGLSSAEVVEVVSEVSVVVVEEVNNVVESVIVSALVEDVVTALETLLVFEVETSEEVESRLLVVGVGVVVVIVVVVEASTVDRVVLMASSMKELEDVVEVVLESEAVEELIQSSQMLAPGYGSAGHGQSELVSVSVFESSSCADATEKAKVTASHRAGEIREDRMLNERL